MSNYKKAVSFGLFGWGLLAIFSIFQYSRLFSGTCYFGSSWLFCTPELTLGGKLWLWFLILVIFSSLIYSGWLFWKVFQSGDEKNSKKKIWQTILMFVFLSFLVVPFGSGDMTFYHASGRVIDEGVKNVFTEDWTRANNFVYPSIVHDNERFSYGPIMAHVFHLVYRASGGGILAFIFLWRILSIFFFALCGWLVFRFIKLLKSDTKPELFYLLWFTSPILLFEWVVSGHFDSLWLIFLFMCFIAAKKDKWWLVIPSLFIGVWIKFVPAFFVPWFALKLWQEMNKNNWKNMLGQLLGGTVLAALVTYLPWVKFWQGPVVFENITILSKWAISSVFAVTYYTLEPLFEILFSGNYHWYLTRFVHLALFLLIIYLLYPIIKKIILIIFKKAKWSEQEFISSILVSVLTYMIFWQKATWPWYVAWAIPIGLVLISKYGMKYVRSIIVWISVSPLVFYIVWLFNWLFVGTDATIKLWFFYYMVLSIYGYPIYLLFKWRRKNFSLE